MASADFKSDGAPIPEALRAGNILRIYPGRYWLADAIYAEARAEIDVTTFLRGRIVNPFSPRHETNDPSDPREMFKPAGGPCYRVLLGRPLKTEDDRDINFILVPEELAHLWRDCELCSMAARILCPECKQTAYCSEYCQHKDWYKRHAAQCGQVIPRNLREDPNRFKNPNRRGSFAKNDGGKMYKLLNTPNKKDGKFTDEYIHNKLYPTNNGTWGHGREEPKSVTPTQWVIAHSPNWMLKVIACCIVRTGFDADDEAELVKPIATSDSMHVRDATAFVSNLNPSSLVKEEPRQEQADKEGEASEEEKYESIESVTPRKEAESFWGSDPWGSDRLGGMKQKRKSNEGGKAKEKSASSPKSVSPVSARKERSPKSAALLF